MKSHLAALSLGMLLSSYLYGQNPLVDVEQVLPCVVYIEGAKIQTHSEGGVVYDIYLRNNETGTVRPYTTTNYGTAFFVGNEINLYLVTAAHVARATSLRPSIVLSSRRSFPVVVQLRDVVDSTYFKKDQLNWLFHPKADVAVIPIKFPNNLPDSLVFTHLVCDKVHRALHAPTRNVVLTVYGFPLRLGIGTRISPISKRYSASSGLIDLPRFDNQMINTFFLIDDPSISGLSGGPVVALPQYNGPMNLSLLEETGLVGIVH
jgi:S1-C subfamily serine protease